MLTIRSFAFVLLALSTASFTLALPERPYAPDLYDRGSLVSESEKRFPFSDSNKPYSPDLYFRSVLEKGEPALPTRSSSQSFVSIDKRSPSLVCKRDSDCGGAHYCSSGSCFMRMGKRALCSRDAMCNSGFCGSQGACLEKRSIGSTCADSTSACADDLFCSAIDKKCKQKRGLEEACRFSEGCQEGLSCLNYKCTKSLAKRTFFDDDNEDEDDDDQEDFITSLQNKLNKLEKESFNQLHKVWDPSPSGSHHKPIWFGKRSDQDSNSNGESFKDSIKQKAEEFEEHLNQFWKPSPSGHHHNPIFLQKNTNEPSQPAPSR